MPQHSDVDLEAFFEHVPIPLHIVAADGTILRANRAECELLGYGPEELIGQPISKFHVDQPVIAGIIASLNAGETLKEFPARLRAKDGSIKHVLISSSGHFVAGEFVHTRCYTRDVTATRQAEERLQQVLDALPAAVYTTDACGRITYYNRAAVDLAGRRPAIGIDQWCVTWRLYRDDGTPLPHDQCPMAVTLKENRPVRNVSAWAERPDGTRIPFVPYPTPLHDENGNLIGAVNMLVDVSVHKRSERTQQLLIDELNHRVKNTLAVVQSVAQQTLRTTTSPSDFVQNFSGRIGALSRAHSLLADSKWKSGELGELLNREILLGNDGEPRVSLSGPTVRLAPRQVWNLALVIHELAVNARKYGALAAVDGKLTVSWVLREAEVRKLTLRWIEQNCPSPVHSSASGFGTKLVQQIAAQEDGHAEMTFNPAGVTWDLEINLVESDDGELEPALLPRQDNRTASPEGAGIRGKRIIILEDELLIAWELRRIIEESGGEVVGTAASVAGALELVNSTPADAALLDANLKGGKSDEIALALSKRNVPFAFVTGYGREALPQRFSNSKLVPKPFTSAEVISALSEIASESRVVVLRGR
ncbi:MAG TPA: HWE histidine kinase domain-containing protein [Nitrospiraceae bacterium]|nr:HWE histidine kinase domain-containing protein [Nitrospiraceae bacterium]